MTDKQIIKSDENMLRLNDICITCVSEIEECDCRKVAEDLCLKLSRKEQECERLRDTYKKRLKIFCDMYNQLKAENEELKNFHINLVGVKECEIKELIKYKQTLKEIKEIAITEDINDECEYTLFGSCAMKAKKQILQKISECEVLDERI